MIRPCMINELIRREFLRGDAIFIDAVSEAEGNCLRCVIVEIIRTVDISYLCLLYLCLSFIKRVIRLRNNVRKDVNDIVILHIKN